MGTQTISTATMAAVVQDRYGTDPGAVLRLEQVERPEPGAGEVLVGVRAAGVDRGTWHLMAGLPLVVRLGYGLRGPKRRVPGLDVAGVVEAVGGGVEGLAPGDRVYGTAGGSFAELAVAPAGQLAPMPEGLGFEQAAAVPVSGLTALQAVRDHGRVAAGQRVLVMGASGGVGSYVVQIARARGAEVTGVASGAKADLVRRLGAAHVVDDEREDALDGRRRYDVIIDTGGRRRLRHLRRALEPRGRLVIVGGEGGGRLLGGFDRQLRAALWSPLLRQHLGTLISSENRADLDGLRELIEAGQVRPEVDRSYPLAEAAAAVRHLAEGRARGKVVLRVAG